MHRCIEVWHPPAQPLALPQRRHKAVCLSLWHSPPSHLAALVAALAPSCLLRAPKGPVCERVVPAAGVEHKVHPAGLGHSRACPVGWYRRSAARESGT